MSQNSRVRSNFFVAGINGVRGVSKDALGGLGGAAGRKKEGIDATVACVGNTWSAAKAFLSLRDRSTHYD